MLREREREREILVKQIYPSSKSRKTFCFSRGIGIKETQHERSHAPSKTTKHNDAKKKMLFYEKQVPLL
jgi:hypothetical protein